ncbi:MAG: proline--tRNA ligase, partial [Pseudomonadota bacterium]
RPHGRDRTSIRPSSETRARASPRTAASSYKDLPKLLYHIQWKFRDEIRPRFGVMRGREFLMKDGYSFDLDHAGAVHSYNKMLISYLRTFERLGVTAVPMRADTGPIGGDLSHEFLILAETGESEVFLDRAVTEQSLGDAAIDYDDADGLAALVKRWTEPYARTDETHDAALFDALPEARRVTARGIEVGHIFNFGTKYSAPMKAMVTGPDGGQVPVQMGSYGIGVSRLVGALIEAHHDEAGPKWPESVAPFGVGVVNLKQGDAEADAASETVYHAFMKAGVEPLYDDRDERAGGKFATMDLVGCPWRVTIGPRGLKNGVVEVHDRRSGDTQEVSPEAAVATVVEKLAAAGRAA